MSNGLTKRQAQMLAAIRKLIAENGYAPSITDIINATGSSSRGGVHAMLCVLRDAGLIAWTKGARRSIRVLDDSPCAPAAISRLSVDDLKRLIIHAEDALYGGGA